MFGFFRAPKISIFVFPMLIFSFHSLQYDEKACKQLCRSVGLSAINTVSSAYKRENNFKYIINSSSLTSTVIPGKPLCMRNDSRSFKYEGVSKSFEPQAFSPFR